MSAPHAHLACLKNGQSILNCAGKLDAPSPNSSSEFDPSGKPRLSGVFFCEVIFYRVA